MLLCFKEINLALIFKCHLECYYATAPSKGQNGNSLIFSINARIVKEGREGGGGA